MKKKTRTRTRNRLAPHRRIPKEHGRLTGIARQLYDLIYAFGLGGCWMSNRTIAGRIECCIRSVQYARIKLVKARVIVTARTCPHTWAMWSRFHKAVQNCQVLLYPVRQQMDNPWYKITGLPVGVQKLDSRGAKLAPKLDVRVLTDSLTGRPVKETAKGPPKLISPHGSAPNPASSSGLTSDHLFKDKAHDPPGPAKSISSTEAQRFPGKGGKEAYQMFARFHRDKLVQAGRSLEEANQMAKIRFPYAEFLPDPGAPEAEPAS